MLVVVPAEVPPPVASIEGLQGGKHRTEKAGREGSFGNSREMPVLIRPESPGHAFVVLPSYTVPVAGVLV
jgi:hypothetical protein